MAVSLLGKDMNLKNLELLLAFLVFYGRIEEAKRLAPIVELAYQRNRYGIFKEFEKLGYTPDEAYTLTNQLWKTI